MPRAEVGTPKWLANKMKAKGLQRLRWFCQMCEKQCRDENGFKCHRMSETHQRQMQIFMQRPGRYMDEFSRDFESAFMRLMRTRYCRARVLANTVYCEVISDKQHVHMNSTIWVTLSDFVLYLGRTGKCTIEHTERGWYIEYIDQEKITREQKEKSKRKAEVAAEEYQANLLAEQVKSAWAAARSANLNAFEADSAADTGASSDGMASTDSRFGSGRICFKLPPIRDGRLTASDADADKLLDATESSAPTDAASSVPIALSSTSSSIRVKTSPVADATQPAAPSFRDLLLLKAKQASHRVTETPNIVSSEPPATARVSRLASQSPPSNSAGTLIAGVTTTTKKRPAAIDRLVMELELEKKRQQQLPMRRAFGTGV